MEKSEFLFLIQYENEETVAALVFEGYVFPAH